MPNIRKGDEFPAKSGILICAKTNPSGSRAYRVDICSSITGGDREQRQFVTKEQAQEYASQRHLEVIRLGHAAFSLTSRQREDAARAIEVLVGYSLSLTEAAKLAIRYAPTIQASITVAELKARYLQAPGRRKAVSIQRSALTLHNLRWRLGRFEKSYGTRLTAEIGVDDVRQWLVSLGTASPVSHNNYRRALHAMFAFAVAEGYCGTNPVAKAPLFAVPTKSPAILTVDQAERLITAAARTNEQLGLLAFIALGLFCGVRRAELERLDWSAIKPERRMVTIDGSIAKSGSIRNVQLSDNAIDWLKLCPTTPGKVAPRNLRHRLKQLWDHAGVIKCARNELRHSFASYHFDLHQNGPMTSVQLGHSSGCQILFEHYRSLVALGDGQRFFSIRPVAAF